MMNPLIQQPVSAYVPQQAIPTIMSDENEVELSSYLNTLFDHRWLIATIALAVALLGAAYAFMVKPVYEASMLVQVEETTQKEAKNILGEMGSMFDVK
jgi:tyrosine-protein kinase Etk/Wzc